jgi:hypothetical protein
MPKSDADLMRDHINLLMEDAQIAEQRPMGLLRSLNLQVQKAFGAGGADTQLWSGNYANSIYVDWRKQAPPGATGEDFIGWYSKSRTTSDVQLVEDSFIRRIVFKAMQGKLDDVITDQQVSQIAHELAKVTARQHLGMTHRLTSASTPEQRDQAMQILQQFIPHVHELIARNQLSFRFIHNWLVNVGKLPSSAVQRAFVQYAKMIQQGKLNLGGISHTDFNRTNRVPITDAHNINALIPILDDFVLACVINAHRQPVGTKTSNATPSPQKSTSAAASPASSATVGPPPAVTLSATLADELKKLIPTNASSVTLPPRVTNLLKAALKI